MKSRKKPKKRGREPPRAVWNRLNIPEYGNEPIGSMAKQMLEQKTCASDPMTKDMINTRPKYKGQLAYAQMDANSTGSRGAMG